MALEIENTQVNAFYTSNNLTTTILNALKEAGKKLDTLSSEDLIGFDQLHTGGQGATLQLAQLANIEQTMSVLDVGGGLGGPARTLAKAINCHVTVLDITHAFCQTGEDLTKLTGLANLVTFQHGRALAIPFTDASFDVVWTQHSTMNISDKEQLYREIYRVLPKGGKLAFQEIMAGRNGPVYYPVFWAKDASINFLRPPEEIRALLAKLGFKEIVWRDTTASAIKIAKERVGTTQSGSEVVQPTLGMHLVLGNNFNQAAQSAVRNLEEERVAIIVAVLQKV